jgi:NAD(P)-dependent dehydrogenase (short-subunit alcohol dehydrogenase family)
MTKKRTLQSRLRDVWPSSPERRVVPAAASHARWPKPAQRSIAPVEASRESHRRTDGVISRITTAKHAALAMRAAKRGLIVEVTENDMIGGGGNPMAQAVKMSQKVLPLLWAAELAPYGVTAIAITPGFLRSESMRQHFAVTEDNWREAGKKDPNFLQSESPLFVGRAVAALAAATRLISPYFRRRGSIYSARRRMWRASGWRRS